MNTSLSTPPSRKSVWSRLMSILIIVSLLLSGYALYRLSTLQPGERVTIPPGVVVEKPVRSIDRIARDPDTRNVIVYYNDGTSDDLGHVPPLKGDDGHDAIIDPSTIAQAVSEYCADGRCDGRSVTPSDVSLAVQNYCEGNVCRGADGQDGKDAVITSDMLATAVATYCSGGLCKGATGDTGATGATGAPGTPTTMSCVIRTVNSLDTRFVAWKYTNEADSAYRDIYKLPNWAECTSPVDLRSV